MKKNKVYILIIFIVFYVAVFSIQCSATTTKTTAVTAAAANKTNLNQIPSESGDISQGFLSKAGGVIWVGDYTDNKPYRGFISYNITNFKGKTIKNATLTLNLESKTGDTSGLGELWVDVVNYGANPLVSSDFDMPGIPIQSFPANGSGNITCNSASLATQLQNAINAGKARFQIRLRFSVPTNNNNSIDNWFYLTSGIVLSVTLD